MSGIANGTKGFQIMEERLKTRNGKPYDRRCLGNIFPKGDLLKFKRVPSTRQQQGWVWEDLKPTKGMEIEFIGTSRVFYEGCSPA